MGYAGYDLYRDLSAMIDFRDRFPTYYPARRISAVGCRRSGLPAVIPSVGIRWLADSGLKWMWWTYGRTSSGIDGRCKLTSVGCCWMIEDEVSPGDLMVDDGSDVR